MNDLAIYSTFFEGFQLDFDHDKYLHTYLLCENEYEAKWRSLKTKIFTKESLELSPSVFQEGYNKILFPGGQIFAQSDFEILIECMAAAGDEEFVIVENGIINKRVNELNCDSVQYPLLKMKFSAKISWEEIKGDFIFDQDILGTSIREFYVFGDSGQWGKYCANDLEYPVDIIGYHQMYSDVFSHFKREIDKEQAGELDKIKILK